MIEVVATKQAELEALCAAYSVRRLALFGSTAVGTWREGTSGRDLRSTSATETIGLAGVWWSSLPGLIGCSVTPSASFPAQQ